MKILKIPRQPGTASLRRVAPAGLLALALVAGGTAQSQVCTGFESGKPQERFLEGSQAASYTLPSLEFGPAERTTGPGGQRVALRYPQLFTTQKDGASVQVRVPGAFVVMIRKVKFNGQLGDITRVQEVVYGRPCSLNQVTVSDSEAQQAATQHWSQERKDGGEPQEGSATVALFYHPVFKRLIYEVLSEGAESEQLLTWIDAADASKVHTSGVVTTVADERRAEAPGAATSCGNASITLHPDYNPIVALSIGEPLGNGRYHLRACSSDPDYPRLEVFAGGMSSLPTGDSDWGNQVQSDAAYFSERFAAYLETAFGYDFVTTHKGMHIVADKPAAQTNGSYLPSANKVLFTHRGDSGVRPVKDLDIVGHEYTHAISYKRWGTMCASSYESAAVNEAFSDLMGHAADKWHYGSPAWVVGRSWNGDQNDCPGGGLRRFDNPSQCRDLQGAEHPTIYPAGFRPADALAAGASPDGCSGGGPPPGGCGFPAGSGVPIQCDIAGDAPSSGPISQEQHAVGSILLHWFYILTHGGGNANSAFRPTAFDVDPADALPFDEAMQVVWAAFVGYTPGDTFCSIWRKTLFFAEPARRPAIERAWRQVYNNFQTYCPAGPAYVPSERAQFRDDVTVLANGASLPVGATTPGQQLVRTLRLANAGDSRLRYRELSISGDGFSLGGLAAQGQLAAGATGDVEVRFQRPGPGIYAGTLRAVTSDYAAETLTLNLTATVTPSQTLGFTSSCAGLQCTFTANPYTGATGHRWTLGEPGPAPQGTSASWFYGEYGSYVVTLSVDTSQGVVTTQGQVTLAPQAGLKPTSGGWYNPAREGHGLDVEHNAQNPVGYVLTWYTYEAGGRPVWYISDTAPLVGGEVSAPLLRFSAGQTTGTPVGSVRLLLSDATHGWFVWTLGGQSGRERFEHLIGGSGRTGLWYPPSQAGWGASLWEGAGQAYATVYLYDGGQPTWVLAKTAEGANPLSGSARYYTRPDLCPGCSGTPPAQQWVGVGTVSFAIQPLPSEASGTATTTITFPSLQTFNRSAVPFSRLTVLP